MRVANLLLAKREWVVRAEHHTIGSHRIDEQLESARVKDR